MGRPFEPEENPSPRDIEEDDGRSSRTELKCIAINPVFREPEEEKKRNNNSEENQFKHGRIICNTNEEQQAKNQTGTNHFEDDEREDQEDFQCGICCAHFTSRSSLLQHVDMTHRRPSSGHYRPRSSESTNQHRLEQEPNSEDDGGAESSANNSVLCQTKCANCGSKFRSTFELYKHRRSQDCHETQDSNNLTENEWMKGSLDPLTHVTDTPENRYSCSTCPQSFRWRIHLLRHIKESHGNNQGSNHSCASASRVREYCENDSLEPAADALNVFAERIAEESQNCFNPDESFESQKELDVNHVSNLEDAVADGLDELDLEESLNSSALDNYFDFDKFLDNYAQLDLPETETDLSIVAPISTLNRRKYKTEPKLRKGRPCNTANFEPQRNQQKKKMKGSFRCSFPTCSFRTTWPSNLKTHMVLVHESDGVNPVFQCPECEFSCKIKHNLSQHMRIHSDERPYKCSYCDYSSRWLGNWRVHELKHEQRGHAFKPKRKTGPRRITKVLGPTSKSKSLAARKVRKGLIGEGRKGSESRNLKKELEERRRKGMESQNVTKEVKGRMGRRRKKTAEETPTYQEPAEEENQFVGHEKAEEEEFAEAEVELVESEEELPEVEPEAVELVQESEERQEYLSDMVQVGADPLQQLVEIKQKVEDAIRRFRNPKENDRQRRQVLRRSEESPGLEEGKEETVMTCQGRPAAEGSVEDVEGVVARSDPGSEADPALTGRPKIRKMRMLKRARGPGRGTGAVHKCPHCSYETTKEVLLRSHLIKHSSYLKHCSVPDCSFRTRWDHHFRAHFRSTHHYLSESDYPANESGERPTVPSRTVISRERPPPSVLYQCPHCPFLTKYREHHEGHLRKHTGLFLNCSVTDCNFRTRWRNYLRQHFKTKHPELSKAGYPRTESCVRDQAATNQGTAPFATFPDNQVDDGSPQIHTTSTSKNPSLRLRPLDASLAELVSPALAPKQKSLQNFSVNKSLSKRGTHIRRTKKLKKKKLFGKEEHKCPQCSYKTRHRNDWKRHLVVHIKEKPYKCRLPDCHFKTRWDYDLRRHYKKWHPHTTPPRRPENDTAAHAPHLSANVAELLRKMPQAHVLLTRLPMDVTAEPKQSSSAPSEFQGSCSGSEEAELDDDQQRRKDWTKRGKVKGNRTEGRFSCPHCPYRAIRSAYLRHHVVIHEPEKPFKCRVTGCSYATRWGYVLRKHYMARHPHCASPPRLKRVKIEKQSEHTPAAVQHYGAAKVRLSQPSLLITQLPVESEEAPIADLQSLLQGEEAEGGGGEGNDGCLDERKRGANLRKMPVPPSAEPGVSFGRETVFGDELPPPAGSSDRGRKESRGRRRRRRGKGQSQRRKTSLLNFNPDERPHKCPHCSYRGKTEHNLKLHLVLHKAEKEFKCSMAGCSYESRWAHALRQHVFNRHPGTTLLPRRRKKAALEPSAVQCEQESAPSSPPLLVSDVNGERNGRPLPRTEFKLRRKFPCSSSGKNPSKLQSHSSSDVSRPFKCPQCFYSAGNHWRLRAHLATHSEVRPFNCPVPACHMSSRWAANVQRHLSMRHPDYVKKQENELCSGDHSGAQPVSLSVLEGQKEELEVLKARWEAFSKYRMKPGTAAHGNTRRMLVACPTCGLRMFRASMSRHMVVHSDAKPFACSVCDYRTRWPADLKAHVKKHRHYSQSNRLVRRKKNSAGTAFSSGAGSRTAGSYDEGTSQEALSDNPPEPSAVPCSTALAVTPSASSSPVKGRRTSSSLSPPKRSPIRPLRLERRQNLKRRKKIMTSDDRKNPYKCPHPHCPYRSISKWHIDRHLVIHTGERPYACSFCNYAAPYKSNLDEHERRWHGNIAENELLQRKHSSPSAKARRPLLRRKVAAGTAKRLTSSGPNTANSTSRVSSEIGATESACAFCEYRSRLSAYLKKHLSKTCKDCGKNFEESTATILPKATEEQPEQWNRPIVDPELSNRSSSDLEPTPRFACMLCTFIGTSERSARVHSRTHKTPVVALHRLVLSM